MSFYYIPNADADPDPGEPNYADPSGSGIQNTGLKRWPMKE
jgi:hypothetical protein